MIVSSAQQKAFHSLFQSCFQVEISGQARREVEPGLPKWIEWIELGT